MCSLIRLLNRFYYRSPEGLTPPKVQWDLTAFDLEIFIRKVAGAGVRVVLADKDYKVTTVSEFKRFLRWARVYEMPWGEEAPDCDDFTRKLKGKMVEPGWWWQPALDCWFANGTAHSELLTVLVEDSAQEVIDARPYMNLYLIDAGRNLFELAEEVFAENGGRKIYNVSQ